MAITFTITAAGGNKIPQSDIATTKNVNLSIASITDTINVADASDITNYDFSWYFIDNPSSTASIDTSITTDNESVNLNSIDTWGSYRIFVIARHKSTDTKSEENPLKAPEENFVTLSVESSNNRLEKPANFERNWKEKYDKVVSVVEDTTKRINVLKVDNSPSGVSFTLPLADGISGQMLTTNGSGQLQFVDLDLSNMENNISLDALTDVNAPAPVDGQVLKWDNTTSQWIPGASTAIDGLTSDSVSQTLTIQNGYSILKGDGFASNNIGSIAAPFDEIHVNAINGQDLTLSEHKLLPEVSGATGEFLHYSETGPEYKFIEISNVLDLQDELDAKLDSGTNIPDENITQTSVVQHNNALSIASMSDFSNYQSQIYRNDTAITITDTGAVGTSFINFVVDNSLRWKINSDGNLLPNTNGLYEIGENSLLGKVAKIWTKDIFTQGLTLNTMTFPSSDGTAGQVLSTDGSGTLSWVAQSGGGGVTDNISEVNAKVETVDDTTDGSRIDFYTEASTNTSIFPSATSPVWKLSESGHLIPGKNATFDIGEAENKVRHLFLSDNSLYVGAVKLSYDEYSSPENPVVELTPWYVNSETGAIETSDSFKKQIIALAPPTGDTEGKKYNIAYSNMGPSAGFSLEESALFTPARLSLAMTEDTNSAISTITYNPFNLSMHQTNLQRENLDTDGNIDSSNPALFNHYTKPLNITLNENGNFEVTETGVYEISICCYIEHSTAGTSANFQTFRILKNSDFLSPSTFDIDVTSAEGGTVNAQPSVHMSTDPVERTINAIIDLNAGDYIDLAIRGYDSNLVKAGTSITIKRIA